MSANDDDADEAQASAFLRALQRVVAIKPRELRSVAWSWLYFFSLLASTFLLRPLRDSLGLIGVGGTLGALAGSKIASLLAKPIGSVNLLFLSIVLLEVAVFSVRRLVVIHRIDAAPPGQNAAPPAAISTADMWRGLKLIISQSYLR